MGKDGEKIHKVKFTVGKLSIRRIRKRRARAMNVKRKKRMKSPFKT